ncbi:hypothetical protein Tco_1162603 [Tanacetum coccineum]
MKAGIGEGSSVAQDKNYKFKEISKSNSDATQSSSCSDTDKEDDKDDTEDSDMGIYEDDDKRDDDAVGFGAVEQKFKGYDQKLEALTSINVPEIIKEVVQAKVLTEMKKQLPTCVPTAIAKIVKPRLNNIVLERLDDKENEISYEDLPRLNLNDVEDMYLMKVQRKLHYLKREF